MAKENTTQVELLADYWPTADQRVKKGEVVEVSVDQAMRLLEAGKARRADPLGA